jgi:protein-L-isoaspartate(D-aspartate) O-methyltransferase
VANLHAVDQVLRSQMLAKIRAEGVEVNDAIEQALLTVPRHKFAHWLSLEQAYSLSAQPLPGVNAETMSTISHPSAVALMLKPLELKPGQRVLEIGAGTGYNAALIAQIVGLSGQVTTVDIEPFIVAGAKANLRETGFDRIKVILGEGGLGYPDNAPYDRIVATVGVWEIPISWFEQLAPSGRIAAPLHLFGESHQHEYVILEHQGNQLAGHLDIGLNMVKMRGKIGGHPSDSVGLTLDFPKQTPKQISLKVFQRSDLNAPKPIDFKFDGQHANMVLEKQKTLIELNFAF